MSQSREELVNIIQYLFKNKYVRSKNGGEALYVSEAYLSQDISSPGYRISLFETRGSIEIYKRLEFSVSRYDLMRNTQHTIDRILDNVTILHNYEKILETDLMRALNGKG